MHKHLLSASSLLISAFIFMLANGLINLLLPVRLQINQFDTGTIGLVLSLYCVGLLFGGLYSKVLIRRVGHIRLFAISGAIAAFGILACSLLTNAWLWGLMRIFAGFCNACIFTAIESWLSAGSTSENRGRILASYQVVILSASFLGQFAINLGDPATDLLFIISAMLLCLSVVPILMSRQAGPKVSSQKTMSFISMAKLSPLGFTGCFFAGMMYFAMFNMLPIFASSNGLSGYGVSMIMAGAVLGAFLLQLPVGFLADRFDRRTVMTLLLVFSSGLVLSVPRLVALDQFWFAVGINSVVCGLLSCFYPLSIAEAYDKLRQEQINAAMGTLLVAYATGGIIGPIAMSQGMSLFGSTTLFYGIAGSQLVLAFIVLVRIGQRQALPSDQQESFVMQSGVVPSASTLDPRTKFIQAKFPLSKEAHAARSLAKSDPSAAVRMACALAKKKPKYSYEIAGALATVEEIDVCRLAEALSETVPWNKPKIFEAILEAREEKAYEVISLFAQLYLSDLADFSYLISAEIPQLRGVLARVAFETLPENTDEIAEFFAQELSDDIETARPADAASGEHEQRAVDLVAKVSENSPEKAIDVAVKIVETVPDAAVAVAEGMASTIAENYINDEPDNETADQDLQGESNQGDSEQPQPAAIIMASKNADQADAFEQAEKDKQRQEYTEAISEAISERVNESAVNIVQRLSEAAPENSIDIAVAVVENVPEASTQVAEAVMSEQAETEKNNNTTSTEDTQPSITPTINDNDSSDKSAEPGVDKEEEDNSATLELISRLSEAAPDQANDMVEAVIASVGDDNPELIEEINEQVSSHQIEDTVEKFSNN